MLKLTKTGIGLLTKQYRSVLRKCLLINLGAFLLFQENAFSELYYAVTDNNNNVVTLMRQRPDTRWSGVYDYHDVDSRLAGKADKSTTYTKTEVNNIQSLNYYYTKTEIDSELSHTGEYLTWFSASHITPTSTVGFSIDRLGSAVDSIATGISVWNMKNGKYIKSSEINTVAANLNALDDAFNYYYTFRVDERTEAAEFALFLDNEKLSSVFEA